MNTHVLAADCGGPKPATLLVATADRTVGRVDGVRYAWSDNPHCNLYNSGVAMKIDSQKLVCSSTSLVDQCAVRVERRPALQPLQIRWILNYQQTLGKYR